MADPATSSNASGPASQRLPLAHNERRRYGWSRAERRIVAEVGGCAKRQFGWAPVVTERQKKRVDGAATTAVPVDMAPFF